MQTETYPTRHSVDDLGNMLKITIPNQKLWLSFFRTGLGAVGSVSLAALILAYRISGKDFGELTLFMIVCLPFLAVLSLYLIYKLLWQLFGNEIIQVSNDGITTRLSVFGFGIPKEYSSEHIGFLRISSLPSSNNRLDQPQNSHFEGWVDGRIMFDYGEKNVKFGNGIDETEAKQILSEIHQKYPKYRTRAHVD